MLLKPLCPPQAQLFVNKTIGELLFDGYEDPVLQIASFNEEEEDEFDMFGEEEEKNEPEPFAIPMDKFGWFYKVGHMAHPMSCRGTGPHGRTAT